MQGMAFGTGSAIAHQAVGAVVGSMSGGGRSAEPTPVAPAQMSGAPQGSGQCVQDKQKGARLLISLGLLKAIKKHLFVLNALS